MIRICCGVSSCMFARGSYGANFTRACLCRCRIGCRGSLKLYQYFAQRRNQLIARNMALLKLNSEPKRLRGRFELKDEWLRALRPSLLFAAFAPRLIARQSALHDAMEHFNHLLIRGLARNLQQERLGKNSVLDALLPQRVRNI